MTHNEIFGMLTIERKRTYRDERHHFSFITHISIFNIYWKFGNKNFENVVGLIFF